MLLQERQTANQTIGREKVRPMSEKCSVYLIENMTTNAVRKLERILRPQKRYFKILKVCFG